MNGKQECLLDVPAFLCIAYQGGASDASANS